MKNIKRIFSVLSAISLMNMHNIDAAPVYNTRGIVTKISATANSKKELFNEISDAYKYYANVLKKYDYSELRKGKYTCEKHMSFLINYRHSYCHDTENREWFEKKLNKAINVLDPNHSSNILKVRYDDELCTLCYYNHIINGGVGTRYVWANYFSKLLNDKQIENYILDVRVDFSVTPYKNDYIVAYKIDGNWYGITCYNSYNSINGEEISDLGTCLKNVSKSHSGDIEIFVDASKCQYFRDFDITKCTEEERDQCLYEGPFIEISKELLDDGNWNIITNKLMKIVSQCHDSKYLREVQHPVYQMVFNLK